MERNQKSTHENQSLIRSLRNAENDFRQLQLEHKRLKDELSEEKKKYRGIHIDKLSADRKTAEFAAEKSKLEVTK